MSPTQTTAGTTAARRATTAAATRDAAPTARPGAGGGVFVARARAAPASFSGYIIVARSIGSVARRFKPRGKLTNLRPRLLFHVGSGFRRLFARFGGACLMAKKVRVAIVGLGFGAE